MPSFKDNKGREWPVVITIAAVKRVRELVKVDLLNITDGDPPLMTRLSSDLSLVCDVGFALVQPVAAERSVSDTEFGESLGGDAIAGLYEGLWEALRLFFQSLQRNDLVKAIEKQQAVVKAAVNLAAVRIEGLSESDILTASGLMSTTAPGFSALTPAP